MFYYDYENYVGFKDPSKDRGILLDYKGAQRTISIFKEPCKFREDIPALYSLRELDEEGYPSIYQIYMHSVDEYDAALKIFGSFKHWKKLTQLKWFMEGNQLWNFEGILSYRKDMKLRDASIAKATIFNKTKEGDLTAAKKLADMSGKTPTLPVREKSKRADKEVKKDLGNELASKIQELHSNIDK